MINSNYLKYLAKSKSIEEFILKYTIVTGNDVRSNIREYELDYYNRVKNHPVYSKELIKNGKISLNDVLSSKLPILLSYTKEIDNETLINNMVTKVYDRNAIVQNVKWNLDLAEDMQAMHGIDIDLEMQSVVRYELEHIK